jgi:flavin-dependent thymidylate synthase
MDSPLKIVLAGMNVDVEMLTKIKIATEKSDRSEALKLLSKLTPETISASYARISRDPDSIPELRRIATNEVEKARLTNQNLIFTMGHKSIAEHAIFNLDIMGLSRRAVEEIERKRLASYTEKSQRYITLDGDFVIPPEIKGTPLEKGFIELIEKQNKFYHNHLPTLIAWHIKQNPQIDLNNVKEKNRIEGYGKEDARYVLAMATQAQIGETISARNLERLITETRSSESKEVRELGEKLLSEINGIAPSVIKYTEPTDYYAKTRKELREHVAKLISDKSLNSLYKQFSEIPNLSSNNIKLFTQLKRDESIIGGIIFSSSNLQFDSCLKITRELSTRQKKEILKLADAHQKMHDPLLREYELGDRVAEITLSSSAFAQLKRHRMNTLISQAYNPTLTPIIPLSIEQTALKHKFFEITSNSSSFYKKMLKEGLPEIISEYALTNAHKRRVLLDANNRQIYAICAERENQAAQWDIRGLANELHKLIRKESPLTTAYLCGKDKFDEVKVKRYS